MTESSWTGRDGRETQRQHNLLICKMGDSSCLWGPLWRRGRATELGKHRLGSSPHRQYCGTDAPSVGRSWVLGVRLWNRLCCLADFFQKALLGNPSSIPPLFIFNFSAVVQGVASLAGLEILLPCSLCFAVLPSFAPRCCHLLVT